MGAIDSKTYGASKKYTDNSIAGGGAIAGKNCTIDSIEPIEGGNRVTFEWTLDNGTVQTSTMDVMDGVDGQDGAKGDTGAQGPQGPKGDMGVSVPEGGTTGQHLRKKSNTDYDFEWESIDAALSNVSEGPVQNKVIKEALDTKVNASVVGAAGGIAELDENGKVPSSQLPSYVDDVIEGYYKEADGKFYEEATYETEIAGEDGKIYISLDSNIQYRWTGTVFSALGGALVLGETSTTAYRGDRGKAAYDTAQTVGDVSNLQTISKTTTVSAINELVGTIASMNIPTGFTPVGTVISVMGNAAPQNYLACNGQTVNIASYPELANYFEAQFGSKNYFGGDGTTTFGIPDLRGDTSVLYCIATKDIYIDARFNYSTDEKVVGTWIDGKPIYQKTIAVTAPNATTSGTEVSNSYNVADDISTCWVVECTNHGIIQTNLAVTSSKLNAIRTYYSPTYNKLIVGNNLPAWNGVEFYVTVHYIKTTD